MCQEFIVWKRTTSIIKEVVKAKNRKECRYKVALGVSCGVL